MRNQEPAAGRDLMLGAADAYCRFLTRRHYENFSVASRFVDAVRRTDLARIYAYCRTTDDLGDEGPAGSQLQRLARWRSEVAGLFAGEPPVHPVLIALQDTIERCKIPADPFLDLIEANVMDQHINGYAAWPELERYCYFSAAPVGRMVLRIFGITDNGCDRLSDDVCIGLQLANHAQDVSRDAAIGRTYLIASDIARGGKAEGVRALVERARDLLASGRVLERSVDAPALRLQLALYRLGGLAICDAIQRIGYQTERQRPHVSTATKLWLAALAALETCVPRAVSRAGVATAPHSK